MGIQIGFTFALHLWLEKFTFELEWELAPCAKCTGASCVMEPARISLLRALERLRGTFCSNLKRWDLLSRMTMVADVLPKRASVSLTLSLSRQQLLRRSEHHAN